MRLGKENRKMAQKAQVCLETAIALVLLLLFLGGAMGVFNSMNK